MRLTGSRVQDQYLWFKGCVRVKRSETIANFIANISADVEGKPWISEVMGPRPQSRARSLPGCSRTFLKYQRK